MGQVIGMQTIPVSYITLVKSESEVPKREYIFIGEIPTHRHREAKRIIKSVEVFKRAEAWREENSEKQSAKTTRDHNPPVVCHL
jgi:hypothetical protein